MNENTTLLVKDFMSTDLFTLLEDDNLRIMDELMKWRKIRHIPVINDRNNVVGIVTHRDLLKTSISALAEVSKREQESINEHINVKSIMQKTVTTVDHETTLSEAASMIYKNKLGCLPVVKDNLLVGIITEADFVKIFVNQ